ncbi:penicillin-insensitive murein endopeptidase [Myxococcota bacterium]|nr:penicillin-insensitive murein endopeptidase [Myxococcota bacterium]
MVTARSPSENGLLSSLPTPRLPTFLALFYALGLGTLTSAAHAAPPGPDLDQLGPFGPELALDPAPAPTTTDAVGDTGDAGPVADDGCDATRLMDGVRLPDLPDLYTTWDPDRAWGTRTLAETLVRVAEEMRWQFPYGDPLVIGDLSREGGGPLQGHRSHQGGLDADVGIYWGKANQHQQGFRTVTTDDIDLAANLAFVQALFDTGDVERILLDRSLIRALRDYAIESGEMTEAAARAMFILPEDGVEGSLFALDQVVHHVPGHHHHFHVRVRCTP